LRFIRDGQRAKLLSQVAGEGDKQVGDWRRDLERDGVLDLFGYDVYRPFIDSFEGIDLMGSVGTYKRRIFIARFGERPTAHDQVVTDLKEIGLDVESGNYGLAESWWLNNEAVADSNDVINATTKWLFAVLMETT
jgi:hypothetical protein